LSDHSLVFHICVSDARSDIEGHLNGQTAAARCARARGMFTRKSGRLALLEVSMNSWQVLNRVCFTICILCIVAGTAFSLSMIWTPYENAVLLKTWGTVAVLFFASVATLIVSRVVGGKAGAPAQS
jgi:hypothetical protein